MYIKLTGIQNGNPVYLARSVGDLSAGWGLKDALCELTYYHYWSIISAVLENNQASNGHTILQCLRVERQGVRAFGYRTPFTCANRSITAVCKEAPGLKQPAGQTPWVYLKDVRTRKNIPCRRATQAYCPSGDLCASCRGKHFRKSPQQSPLYTA